jgi:hypothetical protein
VSLLIFSHIGDLHASAIAAVFPARGTPCQIFCFDEFPVASTITYDLAAGGPVLKGPAADTRLGDFGTVWNRRGWDSVFPPQLHEEDRRLVAPICGRYCDEMRISPPSGQLWVNPRSAQLAMRSKALQLQIVRRLGFGIPETLITNDPGEAVPRARGGFHRQGHFADALEEPDRVIALPTSSISAADLDDDIAIRSCPMIYQRYVEKAYEFRVILFGRRTLWVKIHSQAPGRYKADWRHGMTDELRLEAVEPPPGLDARIVNFCREAGLLHASFDLAVTPSGETIFFEVNEQGQSLWIEEVNPEILVLAMLSAFLWDPVGGQTPPWAGDSIRLAGYLPPRSGPAPARQRSQTATAAMP